MAIDQLGMIIIGGLGSILGSILGAVFTALPELLRSSPARSPTIPRPRGPLRAPQDRVFGLAIVLFLVFEPDGMAARWHTIRNYWKLYPFSH